MSDEEHHPLSSATVGAESRLYQDKSWIMPCPLFLVVPGELLLSSLPRAAITALLSVADKEEAVKGWVKAVAPGRSRVERVSFWREDGPALARAAQEKRPCQLSTGLEKSKPEHFFLGMQGIMESHNVLCREGP